VNGHNCCKSEQAATSALKEGCSCTSGNAVSQQASGCGCASLGQPAAANSKGVQHVRILYGSQLGTARRFAEQLAVACAAAGLPDVCCWDMAACDHEVLLSPPTTSSSSISTAHDCGDKNSSSHNSTGAQHQQQQQGGGGGLAPGTAVLVVVSTYEGGSPPETAKWFCRGLEECSSDFRVGKAALSHLYGFAVFGCGNSLYKELGNFNACALRLDAALSGLGAPRLGRVAMGDEDNGSMDTAFKAWTSARITKLLQSLHGEDRRPKQQQQSQGGAASSSQGDDDDDEIEAEEEEDEMSEGGGDAGSGGEVDMEDLAGRTGPAAHSSGPLSPRHGGGAGPRSSNRKKSRPPGGPAAPAGQGNHQQPAVSAKDDSPPEMLNHVQRANLTKQGYKLIGSHSGVKMCRWTKSMLRGRGGCYKHSFYGIASHRCMEATPSLACANKCVFCWRHHTNPVGRSWRWAMDPADEIVARAVSLHRGMVREYAGAPGVSAERVAEGMDIRHCALSLVGEPIMYPEINALVDELHARRISSFLVTNAQFPDAIRNLRPVTQLYVSVDAATPETLKAVDRPLFADYWERFTECLRLLRDKRQRTVYRLTLVKGMNMNDVLAYAKLLDLGRPDFIEIKGVTYCGDSPASGLTMEKNVPWHHEVVEFSQALCDARNGEYALACEHAHSCCVVLARPDRFLRDGRWHTWIDYHKFHELATSGQPFTSEDYMLPTPSWAVFGAAEAGFDPAEMRWKRTKGKGKALQPSEHGTDSASNPAATSTSTTAATGNNNSNSNGGATASTHRTSFEARAAAHAAAAALPSGHISLSRTGSPKLPWAAHAPAPFPQQPLQASGPGAAAAAAPAVRAAAAAAIEERAARANAARLAAAASQAAHATPRHQAPPAPTVAPV